MQDCPVASGGSRWRRTAGRDSCEEDLTVTSRSGDGGIVRRSSKKRSSRSRERSTSTASRAEPATRRRALAPRLARLLARERRHAEQLADVRSHIDATLASSPISSSTSARAAPARRRCDEHSRRCCAMRSGSVACHETRRTRASGQQAKDARKVMAEDAKAWAAAKGFEV